MQNKHESLFVFFALVFVLSIPFWILDAVYPIELLPGLPLSALGVLAPTLAACILVYKDERFAGVVELLKRSFDFKRIQNKIWILIAILINPVVAILAYASMRAGGVSLPNPAPLTLTIFPLFIVFFISALAEEIGWTGYATQPLMRRWGIVGASVFLGLVWSVWHFIPLLQAHRSPEWIAWWSLWTISLRIIMGWLYIHAGKSVFIAALFHTMINLCWQLFPINGSFYDPRVFGIITLSFAMAFLYLGRFQTRINMQSTYD